MTFGGYNCKLNNPVFMRLSVFQFLQVPKKLEKTGKLEKNWITINTDHSPTPHNHTTHPHHTTPHHHTTQPHHTTHHITPHHITHHTTPHHTPHHITPHHTTSHTTPHHTPSHPIHRFLNLLYWPCCILRKILPQACFYG